MLVTVAAAQWAVLSYRCGGSLGRFCEACLATVVAALWAVFVKHDQKVAS